MRRLLCINHVAFMCNHKGPLEEDKKVKHKRKLYEDTKRYREKET